MDSQAKSVAFESGLPLNERLDAGYLGDLRRIIATLQHLENLPKDANKKVLEALTSMRNEVNRRALILRSRGEADLTADPDSTKIPDRRDVEQPEYKITVYFLGLAKGFTSQAEAEFARLTDMPAIMSGRVRVEVSVIPVFIDDLLSEKWQQRNVDWKDREGKKRDEIAFSVVGEAIVEPKSAV